MVNPIRVANTVVEKLNSLIVPDPETASFYVIKHGRVPKLKNDLNVRRDYTSLDHGYNSISFGAIRDTIPGLFMEVWSLLTTTFPGNFYRDVYIQGLGRVSLFVYNGVAFFILGMEIVYVAGNQIAFTVID